MRITVLNMFKKDLKNNILMIPTENKNKLDHKLILLMIDKS